ncbi:MAG: hypothetical protein HYY17_15980 [Planctomycetes bacterium]|nr:hypothetical protein [Planctomycetota bacterium]
MLAIALVFTLAQDAEREAAEARLRNMKIALDFKGADLDTVIDYVREVTGLNFFIAKKAREKGELQISISVKGLSVKSALALVLKPRGLALIWQDGVFLVTTPDEEPLAMEIYDVRDLLHTIEDMPGAEITLDTSGLGGTVVPPTPDPPLPLALEEIIKTHTGKKSWEENPKATVKLQNGLLVVKQTREVHREIRRLLNQLRRNK